MNERIEKLAEQALGTRKYVPPVWQFYDDELEKFAELIVRECAKLASTNQAEDMDWDISEIILEHFGIDE